MIGMPLNTYRETLRKVPVHLSLRPSAACKAAERIGPHAQAYIEAYYGTDCKFDEISHRLPLRAFSRLSFDEKAKVRFSSKYAISSKEEDEYNQDPSQELLYKIKSSMWRWGYSKPHWNQMVDAYEAIRSFDLGIPGLDVTLDHTQWFHHKGPAKYSESYLDGVFAYLVHYKGEHVMTIGFSIMGARRLLLQQVQLTKRTGNRWLFRMPANRIEHIIGRLMAAFPRHTIMIADGGDIAEKNLREYRSGRTKAVEDEKRYKERLKKAVGARDDLLKYIAKARAKAIEMREKIAHLEADKPRLASFYADTGRYRRGKTLRRNDLTLYALAA